MVTVPEIIQLVLAVIGLASIIVKMTPTPKDDEVLGKIKGFISRFGRLGAKIRNGRVFTIKVDIKVFALNKIPVKHIILNFILSKLRKRKVKNQKYQYEYVS